MNNASRNFDIKTKVCVPFSNSKQTLIICSFHAVYFESIKFFFRMFAQTANKRILVPYKCSIHDFFRNTQYILSTQRSLTELVSRKVCVT